jgi:SAM-dependent methyltransferase
MLEQKIGRAMNATAFRESLRRLDSGRYPEVASYSWNQVYGHGDNMAPGGLFLAARMARGLGLRGGEIVLDLGCGRGDSSIFMAQAYGARVVAVDLWVEATERARKIERVGCRCSVLPLRLDARSELPFGQSYFDAIFCMQAFHSFGGTQRALKRLLGYLRPGGRMCVGGTCFNEEFPEGRLPDVYRQTDGWDAEYSKYHSPLWWRSHFENSGLVEVLECEELEEGVVMWEDEFAYSGERAGWSAEWFAKGDWLAEQLAYGRRGRPYLTHFVATLEKRTDKPQRSL